MHPAYNTQLLDLTSVRARLAAERGWSETSLLKIEADYRAFLAGDITVPKPLVDIFWHMHILDTQKYASDCQAVLGYFLHHVPNEILAGKKGCKKKKAADEAVIERGADRLRYAEQAGKTSKCCKKKGVAA